MLKIWDDFIKKEELEIAPGVIDGEIIQVLTFNTFLEYIDGIIEMGENLFPADTADQLKFVMENIYMCYVYTLEGRYPEPEEISAYIGKPENVEILESMIELCLSQSITSWPETKKKIRETLPMHKLERINWDSDERKENAEKMRRKFEENGGIIRII